MPELPEVETIKRELEPYLIGHTFTGVKVHDARPLGKLPPDEFCSRLVGQTILNISRRGKYILIKLSGSDTLIIHLRMTGSLLWNPPGNEKFTRVEFFFDSGDRITFTDVRRLGTISLAKKTGTLLKGLGMEPLSSKFTPRALSDLLSNRQAPVKAILLNQNLIAGIGNMYADEVLFAAAIHPSKPALSLTLEQVNILYEAIRNVLKKAIRNRGASIRNYRCPDGKAGKAHEKFAVAHRGGLPCPRCGTTIARIVIRQRGTYYCPHCQQDKT